MTTTHVSDEAANPEEVVEPSATDDAVAISTELDTAEKVVFEASRVELNAKTVELGASAVEIETITYMLVMDQNLEVAELSPPTGGSDSPNIALDPADDDDAADAPTANQPATPSEASATPPTTHDACTCDTPAANTSNTAVKPNNINDTNTDDSATPPRPANKILKPK